MLNTKSTLKYANGMFAKLNCNDEKTLDISFDASNVVDMSDMFFAASVSNINLGFLNDTKRVRSTTRMFADFTPRASAELDLHQINTRSITDASHMFSCNEYLYTSDRERSRNYSPAIKRIFVDQASGK